MRRRPIQISNDLSLATALLRMARRNDQGELVEGARGTGFLWDHDDKLFLLTNWHNVTGWDRINNRAINAMGFTPNVLIVEVAIAATVNGISGFQRRVFEIDLLDNSGRPRWREHPSFGANVDVVAIDCPIQPSELATPPINRHPRLLEFDPFVGDEVFILGYPRGLSGGATFPIWKRGSIASEPDFDLDDLPKLLLDAATREGMSGSPVFAVQRGFTRPRGVVAPPNGLAPQDVLFGISMTFLGVYSGRVGDDQLGAQLGVAWKAHVANDIVMSGRPGSTPHD